MPKNHSTAAIVLRSYDISDADRFCILLTEHCGKIAVRARGARKPLSRLGAKLLPLSVLTVELHEGKTGWTVTGAQAQRSAVSDQRLAERFAIEDLTYLQQGIELVLNLIEDEHPVPEIYQLTEQFLSLKPFSTHTLSFSFALLHLLGLLPDDRSEDLRHLSEEEKKFISAARRLELGSVSLDDKNVVARLSDLRKMLVGDHTNRKMRVEEMLPHLSA